MTKRESLHERVHAAVIASWKYAVAYTIIAVVLFAFSSGSGRVQTSLPQIMALYWVCATIIGILAGLLQPFATTTASRAMVGVVAVWPAALGMYAVVNGRFVSELTTADYVTISLLSFAYGVVGSTVIHSKASN